MTTRDREPESPGPLKWEPLRIVYLLYKPSNCPEHFARGFLLRFRIHLEFPPRRFVAGGDRTCFDSGLAVRGIARPPMSPRRGASQVARRSGIASPEPRRGATVRAIVAGDGSVPLSVPEHGAKRARLVGLIGRRSNDVALTPSRPRSPWRRHCTDGRRVDERR
jgi:hypothetical protein